MSKRFTATEKWDDPWFCSLNRLDRLFWVYITDKCDSAGIWGVNVPLVRFYFGEDFILDPERFGGRIIVVAPGKWFVPSFVTFQYGELRAGCRPHDHVARVLQTHQIKGYLKGMDTLKDKNKEKDKDKDKDKDTDKDTDLAPKARFSVPTLDEVRAYCAERKNSVDPQAFIDHYQARGWVPKGYTQQMKDWRAAIRTWERNSRPEGIAAPQRIVGAAAPKEGKYDHLR